MPISNYVSYTHLFFVYMRTLLYKILCFVDLYLEIIVYRETNFKHNLFLVYFVNFYMFRVYLCPSSGGKPYVYNN